MYDRANSRVPGERDYKREKNDGEIQMWLNEEKESRYWKEGEERK
jgi:hypothetical protein